MTQPTIEQAIYGSRDAAGYQFLARSPGFRDDWLPAAQKLCTGFGELPPGAQCPEALFVQPLARNHVAVIRVADRGKDDAGRPGTLAFHLLVLPEALYAHFGGDPFALADLFPATWAADALLPTLDVPAEPTPRRTVAQLQKVLKEGDGPTLLGATQTLVDGTRFVVQRPQPEPRLLRDVWALLPTRSRLELWPATFAVNNAGDFHAVVVPAVDASRFPSYVTEQGAGEYPEGRYELGLQIAVEAGDQAGVDRMLARRTSRETFKYMLILLAGALVVWLGTAWLTPTQAPPATSTERKPGEVAPELGLPPTEEYPTLDEDERAELTQRLHVLARRIGATSGSAEVSGGVVQATAEVGTAEQLLSAIDHTLGTPDKARHGRDLLNVKPVKRALQVLLFKHAVDRYNDMRLRTVELLDLLEKKLFP